MTNSEKPVDNAANSANAKANKAATQQREREVVARIQRNIFDTESSSSLVDLIKNLKESSDIGIRAKFSEIIWTEKINLTSLRSQTLVYVQKHILKLRQEHKRTLRNIQLNYDLSDDQARILGQKLYEKTATGLWSVSSTLWQKRLINLLFGKNVITRVRAEKIEKLIWDEWSILDNATRTSLIEIYEGKNTQNLTTVLKSLTLWAQAVFVGEILDGFRLGEIEGLGLPGFDKNTWLSMAKEEIAQSLVDSEGANKEKIREIVDTLRWGDISNVRLGGDIISEVLKTGGAGLNLDDNLVSELEGELADKIDEYKRALTKEQTLEEREIERQEAYNATPKFDDEALGALEIQSIQNGITTTGIGRLKDPDFQSGAKDLIVQEIDIQQNTRFYRVSAWRDGLDTQNTVPLFIRRQFIGEKTSDGNIERVATRWVSKPVMFAPDSFIFRWGKLREVNIIPLEQFKESVESTIKNIDDIYEELVEVGNANKNIEFARTELEERYQRAQGIGLSDTIEESIPRQATPTSSNLQEAAPVQKVQPSLASSAGWATPPPTPPSLPPGAASTPENPPEGRNPIDQTESLQEDPDSITTIEEFKKRIGALQNGAEIGIEVGTMMAIGKPGRKGYNIFEITQITPTGIEFKNGIGDTETNEVGESVFSFDTLYNGLFQRPGPGAEFLSGTLNTAADILRIVQSTGSGAKEWGRMKIYSGNSEEDPKYFDFSDREYDSKRTPKNYFIGANGDIIEVVIQKDGRMMARRWYDFKASTKEGEENSAKWYEEPKEYSAQFITAFILRASATPWNKPDREIANRPVEDATKPGTVRGIMGRLSVHDLLSGGKKFIEEFKHHLEHGNHLQEQRVMLGIAKKLGMKKWNAEWYYDFKVKYEREEKKLIDDRVETLMNMGTPDRQKSIRNSLLTNTTHDYDHWTNAIAMLKKHGHLYAWELRDLEGTWIFFKRIAGIPLKGNIQDYKEYRDAEDKLRKRGIDNITEQAIIEVYMQTDPHFGNSQIWRMVKGANKEGNENEFTTWETEAEAFNTLDQRLKLAMWKLEAKEYAQGIGAFKKALELPGAPHKKQAFAFALAMSRIPEQLPRSILTKFIEMFDEGRVHSPALMFIKDRESQSLFRDTIGNLIELKAQESVAEWNTNKAESIREDFRSLQRIIHKNRDIRTVTSDDGPSKFGEYQLKNIQDFWNTYGTYLQSELTGNVYEAAYMASDSVRSRGDGRLEEYYKRVTGQLGDSDIMKGDEVDNGTFFMEWESGASVLTFRPDKVLEKLELVNSTGRIDTSNLKREARDDFLRAMEVIRDKVTMSPADKEAYFLRVYTEYCKKFEGVTNMRWLRWSAIIQRFEAFGFEPPKGMSKEGKDGYDEQLSKLITKKNEAIVPLQEKEATLSELRRGKIDQNLSEDEKKSKSIRITGEITELKNSINNYDREINSIHEMYSNWVARFEMSNSAHKKHFKQCFDKFMDPSSAAQTRGTTSSRVNNTFSVTGGNEGANGGIPSIGSAYYADD